MELIKVSRSKLKLNLTSEFNEVAEGDLGGETCKVSEPLNSCYVPLRAEI